MHTKTRNAAKTQSATNALTAFYTPLRWILPFALGVIVFFEIIRAPLGKGNTLNFSILFITLGLFIYGGAHLRRVMTTGVAPRTHALGGLLFTTVWCVGVACANTLSVWLAKQRDYRYSTTDSFNVPVPGARTLIDTNGGLYVMPDVMPDAGLGFQWFAINGAVHLACLLGVAGIGLLIGTISSRWGARAGLMFTAVGLVLAFLTMRVMEDYSIEVQAPVPGVFIFMLPLAVLGLLLAYILSAKTQPRLPSQPRLQ